MTPLLSVLTLAVAPLVAQQPGEVLAPTTPIDLTAAGVTQVGPRGTCGTGSTTTNFNGTVGQAGNMFDIAPSVDMTIECIDMHMSGPGPVDLEFWYCPTTAVGNGTNPAVWTQFATATGVTPNPAGQGNPTPIDISGNGMVFQAGSTYGIYAFIQNYVGSSVGIVWYVSPGTNSTYTGDHCDVTTRYGSQMNWQYLYNPRDWCGTLHTEPAGPSGPALALSGVCPGPVTLDASNMTPGGPVAFYYALSAGSTTIPGGHCAGMVLPVTGPTQLGPFVNADGAGNASISGTAQPNHCGLVRVGAVDIGPCTPTNVIAL